MTEKRRLSAEEKAEELLRRRDRALAGTAEAWRFSLADAVIELFGKGESVTPETLIACLASENDSLMRRVSREQAIKELQVFL